MIRGILTDIEGTTSSLSFVKDVLFPYSRQHLAAFVRARHEEPEVKGLLADVAAECRKPLGLNETIDCLLEWIDADRKVTPLKALQGMIWEAGYKQGDFTGHVYPDAARKLLEWHEAGLALFVFSSGSVQAQKLLFAHTEYGDLTPLFAGNFDTNIGPKQESGSYRRIVERIGLEGADVLFLSDIEGELDAAREAGLHTCKLVREGSDPSSKHLVVNNFDQIHIS